MSINREFNTRRGLRVGLVLTAMVTALVVSPSAMAGVHFGFSLNLDLPPGVHLSVGNYEPYYVGRVFYQPMNAWRPVYSFPVETPYGVEYEPYVYDGGRLVCSDYIPGYEDGYGQFIIEGRGHYNQQWYRGRSFNGYDGRGGMRDRGSYAPYRGRSQHQAYRGYGDGRRDGNWDRGGHSGDRNGDRGWNQRQAYRGNAPNRDGNWGRGGSHGSRNMDHGRNGRERGGSGGRQGRSHRHE